MRIFLPEDRTAKGLSKHSFLRHLVADIIGLVSLSGLIGLLSLTPWAKLSSYEWMGIFFFFAVISIGMWHVDGSPYSRSSDCLTAVPWSIGIGALFLSVDMFFGHRSRPDLPLLQAAAAFPGPGFLISLMVCPGITLIALAGFARSLVLR